MMYLRMLHDKLGLKKFHLSWVPHALSVNLKSQGTFYSKLLLTSLMEDRPTDFGRVITGDESCFFFYCPRDSVGRRRDLPHRINQQFKTEKCLISILWSVNRIHGFFDVRKGTMVVY
jgi:hypothetical protein